MKENFETEMLKPNSNIVWISDFDIDEPGVFAVNLDNILYIKKIQKSVNGHICEFIILELLDSRCIEMTRSNFDKFLKHIIR